MMLRALLVLAPIVGALLASGSVEAIGSRERAAPVRWETSLVTPHVGRDARLESASLVLLGIGLLGSASFLRRLIARRMEWAASMKPLDAATSERKP